MRPTTPTAVPRLRSPRSLARSLACLVTLLAHAEVARAADQANRVSFARDVAPVLLNRCQGCHGPDKSKGDYRLDTFERLLAPGSSGAPIVTPGKPDESNLYRLLVTPDEDDRMPKKGGPLAPAEADLVKRWIEQG